MKTIFVVGKDHISISYIPSDLKGYRPLINEYEIIKKTNEGYRLKKMNSEKNSMYLEKHYYFFKSYSDALEHIALEANSVADSLEGMKQKAITLIKQANDEISIIHGHIE